MRIMKQGLHIFCVRLELMACISATGCSRCLLHVLQI